MEFQINSYSGGFMKEIIDYFDKEIDLTNEKRIMTSTYNIINYFNNLDIDYDIETLSNILIKSNKLLSLIKYITKNNISLFDNEYPINDFILIYDVKYNTNNKYSSEYDEKQDLSLVKLYLNSLPKRLNEEQEKLLLKKVHTDESARKLFIESNLRLVVFIAKKYDNRFLSFLDLIQEGNMGLMHAVDLFDCEKNVRFSTYAVYWIKQYITRAIITKSRTLSLPYGLSSQVQSVKCVIEEYEKNYGNTPSIEKLSELTNIDIDRLKTILEFSEHTLSLFDTVNNKNNEESSELVDTVLDEKTSYFTDDYIRKETNYDIRHELFSSKQLDEKSKLVLALRYGLYDGEYRTLESVGKILGYTKANISRIEIKALRILRASSIMKELAGKDENYNDVSVKTNFSVTKNFKKRYD